MRQPPLFFPVTKIVLIETTNRLGPCRWRVSCATPACAWHRRRRPMPAPMSFCCRAPPRPTSCGRSGQGAAALATPIKRSSIGRRRCASTRATNWPSLSRPAAATRKAKSSSSIPDALELQSLNEISFSVALMGFFLGSLAKCSILMAVFQHFIQPTDSYNWRGFSSNILVKDRSSIGFQSSSFRHLMVRKSISARESLGGDHRLRAGESCIHKNVI